MKIEDTFVAGFRKAISRGMRNPKNSWELCDSFFGNEGRNKLLDEADDLILWNMKKIEAPEYPYIGPKDMELAQRLVAGGSEHRKFLRQIIIWVDFVLPRRVWQEVDTYKVATVRNSCSTMHTLGRRPLTLDDFHDGSNFSADLTPLIARLNELAEQMRAEKSFDHRDRMKAILPECFLQRATYTMSYETALAMLLQRADHRLKEWNLSQKGSICDWILGLPYMPYFYEAALAGKE